MPSLNVSYSNGEFTITGGDDNGADVTIQYGENATITWNRVGENFRFKDVTFDPGDGPFANKTVENAQMSVTDNDQNTSGEDESYEYTITIRDEGGILQHIDPKVINKASSGRSVETKATTVD